MDRYVESKESSIFRCFFEFFKMIGSLSFGMAFLFAFISSFLVDFFGCILIGIIGGLISSIGLLGSALILKFNASILYHFITYGLIFGIGQRCHTFINFKNKDKCYLI